MPQEKARETIGFLMGGEKREIHVRVRQVTRPKMQLGSQMKDGEDECGSVRSFEKGGGERRKRKGEIVPRQKRPWPKGKGGKKLAQGGGLRVLREGENNSRPSV